MDTHNMVSALTMSVRKTRTLYYELSFKDGHIYYKAHQLSIHNFISLD